MAQQQPDLTGRRAGLWDLEEWARRGNASMGGVALAPTAALSAVWQLTVGGIASCYLEELFFSSDTAIGWTLWLALGGLGLANLPLVTLGPFGGGLAGVGAQAGLIAAPAPARIYAQGFVTAGFCGSILGRAKIFLNDTNAITLQTTQVAANCAASFTVIGATS